MTYEPVERDKENSRPSQLQSEDSTENGTASPLTIQVRTTTTSSSQTRART